VGDGNAPVAYLMRMITSCVAERHGPGAVQYIHPWLTEHVLSQFHLPCWALLRLPGRLVALMAMTAHAHHLHDFTWHLNQADAVLLAINAAKPGELRRELGLLAAYRGIGGVNVFVDAAGVAQEQADLVERETRVALMMAGLPGDDLAFIRRTSNHATDEAIDETLAAIGREFRTPAWDAEGPLRMVVRTGGPDSDRGRITSGCISRGDAVCAFRKGEMLDLRVMDVRRFGHPLDYADAGQNVAVTVGPMEYRSLGAGAVIADVDGLELVASFLARVTFFTAEDGGRSRYVMSGYVPTFLLPAAQRKARIELLDRVRAYPGETFPVRATFLNGRSREYVRPGDPFVLRRDGRIIGHGVVE
jgi:elongation factor Tu